MQNADSANRTEEVAEMRAVQVRTETKKMHVLQRIDHVSVKELTIRPMKSAEPITPTLIRNGNGRYKLKTEKGLQKI